MSNEMTTETRWSWWVGSDDERYYNECASREEAVRIAKEEYDGAYIVEAAKPSNIMLSEYFVADWFMEGAEEHAYDDHGDPEGGYGTVFEITAAQQADLETKVRAAIDAWQTEHELVFTGFKFSEARNSEYIPPQQEAASGQ